MKQIVRIGIVVVALAVIAAIAPAVSQDDPQPAASGTTENVDVALVLIDTLVLDAGGASVPGMTREEFLLAVDGKAVEIDTFDAVCPEGAREEPKAVSRNGSRDPVPAVGGRRIVLAFDYFHNRGVLRQELLDGARAMIDRDMAAGDEMMIVALAGGLRVEQRFTAEADAVFEALERMEKDVTLWARDFDPLTDRSFFESIATLLTVLGETDGAKAVVLFSAYDGPSDTNDLWYQDVAQRAGAVRTSLYPMDANGLNDGRSVGAGLARLATETGGRLTRNTNDISLAYARAQRDLSCRYTLGFYIDIADAGKTRQIRVRTTRSGQAVRAPEVHRMGTEDERMASRLMAAFVDPGLFDDPLVRAHIFPMRPASKKEWDAVVTLGFRIPAAADVLVRDVGMTLTKGTVEVDRFSRRLQMRSSPDTAGDSRLVTLVGRGAIPPGAYDMTVVIADPSAERVQTTRLVFEIPELPRKQLLVQDPVLARIVPDGVLYVFDGDPGEGTREGGGRNDDADILAGGGVEPMLVTMLHPEDAFLAISNTCAIGVADPPSGTTIDRRIVREDDGTVVHELAPVPVALEGAKKLRCQRVRDRIEGGTLAAGEYRLEVGLSGDGPSGATRFTVR